MAVLHIVDWATSFQAARFLKTMSRESSRVLPLRVGVCGYIWICRNIYGKETPVIAIKDDMVAKIRDD